MPAPAKAPTAARLIVQVLRDKVGSEDEGGALERLFLINDPAGTFWLMVSKWDDPTGSDQDTIKLSLTIGDYTQEDSFTLLELDGEQLQRLAALPAFMASAVAWMQACGLLRHTSPQQRGAHATVPR